MKNEKKSIGEQVLIILGGISLMVISAFVIPVLVDRYAKKSYKKSLVKREKIVFDNMGPEIVPIIEKGE